ncbi:MAG: heavy metal translocating P-type ATPase [Candidatus Anammoxibacter sp.]
MDQNKTINTECREFRILGLNCIDCAGKIEHAVSKLKWVKDVKVHFSTSLLNITTENCTKGMDCMEAEIEKKIAGMGFGIDKSRKAATTFNANKKKLFNGNFILTLTIASGLSILAGLVASSFGTIFIFKTVDIPIAFYLLTICTGGYYIGRRGVASILNMRLDINFLMCIAVVGAACIGEWLEGATVIFLFLLAQLLETYTLDKARNAIRSLMELSPKEALVKENGGERKVSVDSVKIGDVILVKPGERIPLDGKVVSGISTVNQSPVTGESISIEKSTGDEVYAGTINENGSIDIEVTHISKESTLAKIIHLIEDAQSRKAPFQNFVDNFARYYTPIVMLLAILVASVPPLVFHESFSAWFYRALVLLVISCPCALVISTPVSLIAGITNAAKNGILFKGGVYLEHIGNLKAVAFDKTGTLTKGTPVVTDIIALNRQTEDDILRIAASIETRSEHSIANALLKKAKEKNITLIKSSAFQAITGKGAVMEIDNTKHYIGNVKLFRELDFPLSNVDDKLSDLQNEGKTTLLIGADNTVFGIIAVADEVRNESAQTISELNNKGINKIVMLTGDYKKTAEAISGKLNIGEVLSELSPEDKVDAIKSLINKHGRTCMVGDGINDAPALTAATVGIAMGKSGADIALESADVTIMSDDLSKLPIAIELGRQTMRVIKQNICIAILLKVIFLALTVPGITTLWMAVGADMGASLIVIMNSLRLLRNG